MVQPESRLMAACIVEQGGKLVLTTIPPESCPGFIVWNATEYQNMANLLPVFGIPSAVDLAAAWQAGFVIPMALGLVAWAAAKIISIWKD